LYYARPDGSSVTQVARGLLGPNGCGLSPGGDRVYVAESYTGRLLAWDVTGPGTVATPMATVVEATKGHFDSMAVEADGNVVVAAIGEGLCVVDPKGGHRYVELPDRFTTNVCFGGDDMKTGYATLSGGGRLVAFDWPRPGLKLSY
jgi:gluconolactonase